MAGGPGDRCGSICCRSNPVHTAATGAPTSRVSPADATEAVLAETDLGEGMVRGADLRDGKLFVLREIGSTQSLFYRSPIIGELEASWCLILRCVRAARDLAAGIGFHTSDARHACGG